MARRFVRGWFDGELKEVNDDSPGGRQIIAREYVHYDPKRSGAAYDTTWECTALGVPLSQMADFNEAAQRNGTGAYYKPHKSGQYAVLCADSKAARNRELAVRGKFDLDAGYGDYAGR